MSTKMTHVDQATLLACADSGAQLMRALAHEGRLMICCHLIEGERTVSALESLLGARQSSVSQQLARLRLDGIVAARREGKAIHYSLASDTARSLIVTLSSLLKHPTA